VWWFSKKINLNNPRPQFNHIIFWSYILKLLISSYYYGVLLLLVKMVVPCSWQSHGEQTMIKWQPLFVSIIIGLTIGSGSCNSSPLFWLLNFLFHNLYSDCQLCKYISCSYLNKSWYSHICLVLFEFFLWWFFHSILF
jgi:hypothetical protein